MDLASLELCSDGLSERQQVRSVWSRRRSLLTVCWLGIGEKQNCRSKQGYGSFGREKVVKAEYASRSWRHLLAIPADELELVGEDINIASRRLIGSLGLFVGRSE